MLLLLQSRVIPKWQAPPDWMPPVVKAEEDEDDLLLLAWFMFMRQSYERV